MKFNTFPFLTPTTVPSTTKTPPGRSSRVLLPSSRRSVLGHRETDDVGVAHQHRHGSATHLGARGEERCSEGTTMLRFRWRTWGMDRADLVISYEDCMATLGLSLLRTLGTEDLE